jgi:hypothetical protein
MTLIGNRRSKPLTTKDTKEHEGEWETPKSKKPATMTRIEHGERVNGKARALTAGLTPIVVDQAGWRRNSGNVLAA